jgi:ADP-dependent NAD(P)H-hydrate dehydratase
VAATIAAEQIGFHMVATDLIENLPKAMKPFDEIARQKI